MFWDFNHDSILWELVIFRFTLTWTSCIMYEVKKKRIWDYDKNESFDRRVNQIRFLWPGFKSYYETLNIYSSMWTHREWKTWVQFDWNDWDQLFWRRPTLATPSQGANKQHSKLRWCYFHQPLTPFFKPLQKTTKPTDKKGLQKTNNIAKLKMKMNV